MKKGSPRIQSAAAAGPMFVTWSDEKGKQAVLANPGTYARNGVVERSSGSSIFRNIETNISVRDGYSRDDYNAFRPEEATPGNAKGVIKASMYAYKKIGIVRNVIDLMADFACQGIEIVHPNKRIEKFFQFWARKVNFRERSERFLNLLYRTGNVVVKRVHAKLKKSDIDRLQRGQASPDVEVEAPLKLGRNEIPWGYAFHNPLKIEVIGGEDLALFAGKVQYAIRVPGNIAAKIKNAKSIEQKLLIELIPDYIVNAIKQGKTLIPLNPDKVSVYHYKKDDWDAWAEPLTAGALDDLTMLNKLKLADISSLDGAISHVRLWKLGSLADKIYPTEAAIARLADMLASSVGGGVIDIVWGPEIDIKETATDMSKFLGSEKYTATLIAIYDAYGIPIALTGYASKGSLSNNSLSLKTLIERLEYGRSVLVSMWQRELADIQEAFNFRLPADIRFSRMTLQDEAAEKSLLIQMADRNLISTETIQERFGEIPELELLRQNREERERKANRRPRKASQWHNPEHKEGLEKIALQTGVAAPSQVGLELPPPKNGEEGGMQMKLKSQEAMKKLSGRPGQGRPLNSKDKQKRKQKKGSPQTGKSVAKLAQALSWTRAAQEIISKVVNRWYLEANGKKNMRTLSDEEAKNLESFKYAALCNCEIYENVDEDVIGGLVSQEEPLVVPDAVQQLYKRTHLSFSAKFNREPTIDETRQIQASVYALFKGGIDNGES